jgi:hypothetical protein
LVVKVERENFIAALARLKPALASGGVIQELSHVWFDEKFAYAYDGGFGIKLKLPSELKCGVPGTALLSLLGTSALDEVELEPSGAALQVKLGKSTSKLAALDGERMVWPFPAKVAKARPTELDETFIEGLRKTLFVKASSPTRLEHHGVMVCRVKADLHLFATDSATMVRVIVKDAGTGASFDKALLPRDFAEQIVAQSPEGVKLFVLDDCMIAEGAGVTFYSNVLDISAAEDLGAIVDGQLEEHPKAVALPAGLESTLARAEILSGSEEAAVELAAESAGLKVSGSYKLGTFSESLPLEGKLPSAKLRIRAEQLRKGLTHAEEFSLTKGSLVLRGTPEFVYVISPL